MLRLGGLWLLMMLPLAAQPIRVQLTTGGHPHDISFYSVFGGHDDLAITVNPHPSAYKRDLRKFVDVLVLYDLVEVTDEKEQANLRQFLESGHGMVVLHHAIADNWRWQWWWEEVMGHRYFLAKEGDTPRSIPKEKAVLDIKPVAKHPVLEGVGEIKMEDESYKGMWISPKSLPLMETDNPENDKVVVWISPYQKSRVIGIQMGHGPGAHRDPGYRRLVYNAILWAAGKKE